MKKSFYAPGRLYFFPAFLPLVEIVPWLISLLGLVAAAAGFSFSGFFKKYKKILVCFSVLCFATVAGIWIASVPAGELGDKGSVLLNSKQFPSVIVYSAVEQSSEHRLPRFAEKWSVTTKHQILSTPVIQDDLLIYGSYKGTLEAVSRQSGKAIWSLPKDTYVMSLSKDNEGNIYAGEGLHETQIATLTSFNVKNRTVNWQRKFIGHIESPPVIDEKSNRVWMSSGPGGLWAMNKDNGDVHLHAPLGHLDSRALVYDNKVYVQAQADEDINLTTFSALNEDTGETIWQISQPGQPWGSPILHRNQKMMFSTTGLGQIGVQRRTDKGWAYAISLDGEIIWQIELPGMALQPGIYIPDDNLIIHTMKSGEIIALEATHGGVRWQVKAGESFMARSTFIDHLQRPMIASISYDGHFAIRDARTGRKIASAIVGKYSSSAPVVSGDTIYTMSAYEITAFGGLYSLEGQ